MADRQFDINLVLNAMVNDAAQVDQALENLKRKTDDAGAAAKRQSDALDGVAEKGRGATDVIGGLASVATGGAESIGGLTRTMRGLGEIAGVGGPIGILLGALGSVAAAIAMVAKHAAEMRNEVKAAGDAAAATAEKFTALDQVKLDFSQDIQSLTALADQFTRANQQADLLRASQNRLKDAQTALALQQVDADEAAALAGAGTDRDRQAIRLQFQRQRSGIQTGAEADKAAGAVGTAEQAVARIDESLAQLAAQFAENKTTMADAKAALDQARATLSGSGIESDQVRRQRELADLASRPTETMSKGELRRLGELRASSAEDRQAIDSGVGQTYGSSSKELEQRRDQVVKRSAATPEARDAELARIDSLLRMLAEMPRLAATGQQTIDELAKQSQELEARIAAQRASAAAAAIDLQTAQVGANTAAVRSRTVQTSNATAQTQFDRAGASGDRRAALEAELAALQAAEGRQRSGGAAAISRLQARAQSEQADVAGAEGAIEEFTDSTSFSPRSASYRREIARLEADLAKQQAEAAAALALVRTANAELAATLTQIAVSMANVKGQIVNSDN